MSKLTFRIVARIEKETGDFILLLPDALSRQGFMHYYDGDHGEVDFEYYRKSTLPVPLKREQEAVRRINNYTQKMLSYPGMNGIQYRRVFRVFNYQGL